MEGPRNSSLEAGGVERSGEEGCTTMRTGEGTGEEGTSLEAAPAEESVIVISDDEGEVTLGLGNSVLLIEEADQTFTPEKRKLEVLDDELAITFSKRAHVMPHARYDCTLHAFARAEQETEVPLEQNSTFCPECYCYLCDKPASECSSWTSSSCCHCNAHNKSKYWKERRDTALAGILTIFNFDLTEIDSELREGGDQLQSFITELSQAQKKYMEGLLLARDHVIKCTCACHRNNSNPRCNACTVYHIVERVYNYLDVHKLVTEYLNRADGVHPNTAAVMLLGAARELALQKTLVSPFNLSPLNANVEEATSDLMGRIVSTLQRLLVVGDYPKNLYEKFVMFFQSLPLPSHLSLYKNSLNVSRWDNLFLSSVLAGQNPTGVRTHKGKRESLWEPYPVVESRVKRLEESKSYRQLVRYLNAVSCPNDNGRLFNLKKKLALYMCKFGDFVGAAASLLLFIKGMKTCVAKNMTPAQFEFHLLMLKTRSCPPGNEPVFPDVWIPSEGFPLKKGVLLRTAIRIIYVNKTLLCEPACWSSLVRVWCTSDNLTKDGKLMPAIVPIPNKPFKLMVMEMSCHILDELQSNLNAHLPAPFHKGQTATAELIVIVQAVFRFMASGTPLRNMFELVLAFGLNVWAVELLIENVTPMHFLLMAFMASIQAELRERERQVLDILNVRGAYYVSELLCVFLLHPSEAVRRTGTEIIVVLLQNMARYTWTPVVGNVLNARVVNMPFHSGEEKRQMHYLISRLISRV